MTSRAPHSQFSFIIFMFFISGSVFYFCNLVSSAKTLPSQQSPPKKKKKYWSSSIWRAELGPSSAGAVPLCRKGRNLNTAKPLQVRSRGRGWFETQMNKLQWSLHPEETRAELWSLVPLAGSTLAEAPSKRPKPSSSAWRPQWGTSIIACYNRTICILSAFYKYMYTVIFSVFTLS